MAVACIRYDAGPLETLAPRTQGLTVIRDVAAQTGSTYVDLRAAFKGPDHAYDETQYLASDGIHPNAGGHEKIAAALAEVAPKGM